MQFITNVFLLAAAAIAAPISSRQSSDFSHFTLIAAHSGSPIHLLPVEARGLSLWVGGGTNADCPVIQDLDCSQFANVTAFVSDFGNPTIVAMDSEVPGGQGVYIAPGGAVQFGEAHSNAEPEGSVNDGFSYAPPANGAELATLAPVANGSTGFLACPPTAEAMNTGPWQVFADVESVEVPSGCVDDCIGFDALATPFNGTVSAAWQYD